ncbi:hypothetical protein JL720_12403 [Aureococcus anophagefferens]|nr:hypothetical protein JL720_12403 [Aureococcus anophagefferens]
MELCGHGDVEGWLRSLPGGALPDGATLALFFQMCFSLYASRAALGLRHYDVKLLNFLAAPVAAATVARYAVGPAAFDLRLDPALCGAWAKLADFGTSRCDAASLGAHADGSLLTTVENAPADLLVAGDAADFHGSAHDTFSFGLAAVHLFGGCAPYEELMADCTCPAPLRGALAKLWLADGGGFSAVATCRTVYDDDGAGNPGDASSDDDGVGEPYDRTLFDTLYRFFVLLGVPEADAFGPAGQPVLAATRDHLLGDAPAGAKKKKAATKAARRADQRRARGCPAQPAARRHGGRPLRCAARARARRIVSDRAGSHGVAVHENTPACKLKAEVGHVADSAKAAEFARREGSAAFEATRAATVERVIAGREASSRRASRRRRPARARSPRRRRRRSPPRRRRRRGRGGDAPGLPHAMELMFAAVDAQRHTWAAQREAYLAVATSEREGRREFKATGDDYGAAARAPEARVLQRVADVLRDAAAAGAAAERRARAEPHGGQGGRRGGRSEVAAAGAAYEARRSGARAAASAAAARAASRAALAAARATRRRRRGQRLRRPSSSTTTAAAVAATFDASVFALPGARLLEHWDLRHVGVFNPSVVALPAALRDTLRRSVYPDAYYVATVRHSWEQCFRFDIGHAKWATVGPDRSDAERPGRHTSVVLLDRDLCALGLAAQRFPDPWDARRGDVGWLAEDVRLFAHNAQSPLDSRLIATAVVVHDKSFSDYDQEHFNQSFGVFELVLDVDAKRRPTARYIPLPGESRNGSSPSRRARP